MVRRFVPVGLVLAVQLALFPMPPAVWLEGLILGLLGALMAVGLALVYRLHGIINFAQGDLGGTPAVLAYGLIGLGGVNYFAGLATGLVGAVVVTVILEVLLIRRLARSPRLVLTVATIAASQVLIVVALLIPRLWGVTPIATASISFPWHLRLTLSPLVFTANDVVAGVISLAGLAGVAVWFRASRVGMAARATGDRRALAAMLGVPVSRLQTLTWVVAGVLSFLSVFLQAAILGLPLDPTYSLTALVMALGALALGGFGDLPVVAVAAVVLGLLNHAVAWNEPTNPSLGLAVVAAVVIGGMLVRQLGRPGAPRDAGAAVGALAVVSEPDPPLAGTWYPAARAATVVVVVGLAVGLGSWLGPGTLLELAGMLALAVAGCSVVVLTGWSGQVSLGQMSFAAAGAVAAAVAIDDWHLDVSLALLFAGVVAGAVAAVVAIPTLRLEGIFVAVTTLAFGLAASGYLLDRAEFSWIPQGSLSSVRLFGVTVSSERALYWLCLGVTALVVAGVGGLRRSRFGRVQRALQDNPAACEAYGVSVVWAKLAGFVASGFVAGLAGCLLLLVNQQYVETSYDVTISLVIFTATVVGGLGSVSGAVLGAALVEGTAVFLPPSWQLLPASVGVLVVLLAAPGGVVGLWCRARDGLLHRLASKTERLPSVAEPA